MKLQPLDLNALGPVDWARLAFPQDDGYDTAIFEKIVGLRWGWKHEDPGPDAAAWLDGQVTIDDSPDGFNNSFAEPHKIVEAADSRWAWAGQLLKVWPEQRAQFRRLTNSVRSFYAPAREAVSGCSCGSFCGNPYAMAQELDYPYHWGRVWATFYCGTGFLEGICHELAHWKGYALGIYITEWENLIFANTAPSMAVQDAAASRGCISAEEADKQVALGLGFQPLRPQLMRPLGACFQEQWCCVHMMALHLRIYNSPHFGQYVITPHEADPTTWIEWAVHHVKRTYMAHMDMLRIAQPSPGPGAAFWHGYCAWVDAVLAEAIETYHIEDVEDYEPTCYPSGD